MENHNSEHGHEHHESILHKKRKTKTLNKYLKSCKKNSWIIVSGILAIILVIILFTGNSFAGSISAKEAGQKIIELANAQGAEAELVKVNDDGNFYEVILSMQGQEVSLYVTKDGKSFTQALIPLSGNTPASNNANQQQTPSPAPTQTTYSENDLAKIKEFSQCLADNGVKAYGAGWCGYCKKFKEAFGGAEQITPFYLECQNADRTPTEYADLCEQEQIRGFPTIKINGEIYSGARTIDGLAAAIDKCDAPELEGASTPPVQASGYTKEDITKLKTFNDCLGEKNVKVYGASWCGWTKKWVVETLGGVDTASAIYVECTEEKELCSTEGVKGYPTTKINGKVYSGDRTIVAIAQATGCPAPELEGSSTVTDTGVASAGCGA